MADMVEYYHDISKIRKALREWELHRLELEKEALTKSHKKERRYDELRKKVKDLQQDLKRSEAESRQRIQSLMAQVDSVRKEHDLLASHTERLRERKRQYEIQLADASSLNQFSLHPDLYSTLYHTGTTSLPSTSAIPVPPTTSSIYNNNTQFQAPQYPVQLDQQTVNSKFHPAVQAHSLPQPHNLLQNVNSNRESTLQQNIYPSHHHSETNYIPAYSNPVGPAPSAATRGFGESQAMSTPSVYGINDSPRKVSFRQDEPNVSFGINDGYQNVSFKEDEPISGFGMDDGSRKVSTRQDEPNISQTSIPSHKGTIGTSLPRDNSMVRTSYKDEPQVINYSPGKEFNDISAYTVERRDSSTVCDTASGFTHREPIVNQIPLQEMNHEEVPRELDRKFSAPERNSEDYALNREITKSETLPTTRVTEMSDNPHTIQASRQDSPSNYHQYISSSAVEQNGVTHTLGDNLSNRSEAVSKALERLELISPSLSAEHKGESRDVEPQLTKSESKVYSPGSKETGIKPIDVHTSGIEENQNKNINISQGEENSSPTQLLTPTSEIEPDKSSPTQPTKSQSPVVHSKPSPDMPIQSQSPVDHSKPSPIKPSQSQSPVVHSKPSPDTPIQSQSPVDYSKPSPIKPSQSQSSVVHSRPSPIKPSQLKTPPDHSQTLPITPSQPDDDKCSPVPESPKVPARPSLDSSSPEQDDSDFFDNEVPITASAAYQRLIGAGVKPGSGGGGTESDSDGVEGSLAPQHHNTTTSSRKSSFQPFASRIPSLGGRGPPGGTDTDSVDSVEAAIQAAMQAKGDSTTSSGNIKPVDTEASPVKVAEDMEREKVMSSAKGSKSKPSDSRKPRPNAALNLTLESEEESCEVSAGTEASDEDDFDFYDKF